MGYTNVATLILNFLLFLSSANSNCPANPQCNQGYTYRSLDGSCNNLANSIWGTANLEYHRLLPAVYNDGISTFRLQANGSEMPNARTVSNNIFRETDIVSSNDPVWTLALMQYGQIMAHDMSNVKIEGVNDCCNTNPTNTRCANIAVPPGDPLLDYKTCLPFIRTTTNKDLGCYTSNTPVNPISDTNAFLDCSIVYGLTVQENQNLRTLVNGKMKVEERNGAYWPPRSDQPTLDCFLPNTNEACYKTGDRRMNQNLQLAAIQIILLRHHNYLCDKLISLNPSWNDEKVFQEARKILIAIHQRIIYYELLPIFYGNQNVLNYGIVSNQTGFVNDYDGSAIPAVSVEHASVAHRYFHTAIQGSLNSYSEAPLVGLRVIALPSLIELSEWFWRPDLLEGDTGRNFGKICRGMVTQPEQRLDNQHTDEIRDKLFRNASDYGEDLKTIDIQRGRDHGLPSYNDYLEYCDRPRAKTFSDFSPLISDFFIDMLENLYNTPNDVEFTVAGSLEEHVDGALVGPTFLCVMLEQYKRTRQADRFWFEREYNGGLTLAQLAEIRKMTFSRMICDNTDTRYMQPDAFRISTLLGNNNIRSCSQIPNMDFSPWKA